MDITIKVLFQATSLHIAINGAMSFHTEIDCGDPEFIQNGHVSYNTTSYNSSAHYTCTVGYNMVGCRERTCTDSGRWSGSPPECAGQHHVTLFL